MSAYWCTAGGKALDRRIFHGLFIKKKEPPKPTKEKACKFDIVDLDLKEVIT